MAIRVYTGNAKIPEWTEDRARALGRRAYLTMAEHDYYGREHIIPTFDSLNEEDQDAWVNVAKAVYAELARDGGGTQVQAEVRR